jgi:hypothetical protein
MLRSLILAQDTATVAGVLNETRALIAEHQRRLGSRDQLQAILGVQTGRVYKVD